jgi:hypothetical protein
MQELDPFLANFNPVVRYLNAQRASLADFLAGPSVALSNSLDAPGTPGEPAARHYLRQIGYESKEALSMSTTRFPEHRNNGYLQPGALNDFAAGSSGIFPNFDCKNLDYEPNTQRGDPPTQDEEELKVGQPNPYGSSVNNGDKANPSFAPCIHQNGWQSYDPSFGDGRFPGLFADP